ncbi:MAG: hypothetical protein GWP18_06780 [Proteobacteria bacterium]|nr:hypothetical protein [Pseudomonadota bacterium]
MPRMFKNRIAVLSLLVVIALFASACTNSGTTDTSTSTSGVTDSTDVVETTNTEAPLTTLPSEAIPGTNSPSVPSDVAESMRQEIGALMLDAEESRGLPFLSVPTVILLDSDDFTQRVNADLKEDIDSAELASDEALFKLMGLLDDDADLEAMLIALYTEQVAGFYDPEVKELVVPVSIDGITPLQRVVIVHELVHALTDQHFDFNDEYERRLDEGTGDDAAGLLALIEGDATYQQFLFLEGMSPADAVQVALEAIAIDTSVLDLAPEWMQKDLSFPYEQGLGFVGELVATGGLKGVDEAYQDMPFSTEQILDPNKYLRSEGPDDLDPLTVSLDGWDLSDEATFGEWGIRMLLTDTVTPGAATQAGAGWGNDTYRFFERGDDAAIAWTYAGETEQDAEDLVDALILHARGTMGAGDSREAGGGLLFDGGSPYVFIDRVDDVIFFIASTDPAAGADLREQLGL